MSYILKNYDDYLFVLNDIKEITTRRWNNVINTSWHAYAVSARAPYLTERMILAEEEVKAALLIPGVKTEVAQKIRVDHQRLLIWIEEVRMKNEISSNIDQVIQVAINNTVSKEAIYALMRGSIDSFFNSLNRKIDLYVTKSSTANDTPSVSKKILIGVSIAKGDAEKIAASKFDTYGQNQWRKVAKELGFKESDHVYFNDTLSPRSASKKSKSNKNIFADVKGMRAIEAYCNEQRIKITSERFKIALSQVQQT